MPRIRVQEKYAFLIPWLYTYVERFKTFDIETTGFDPRLDKIFAYCIGHWNGQVDVYRLDHKDDSINKRNWQILLDFFADTSISKIAHNFKFELSFLNTHNVPVPEETVWHDTMLMSQLLRNLNLSHALDYLAWELAGHSRDLDFKVKKLGKLYGTYQKIDKELFTEYQVADGIRPMILFRTWYKELKSDIPLWNDYINEIELVKVTERMENYGMQVDIPNAIQLLKWVTLQYQSVVQETREHLGFYLNLNSDKKLAHYLYNVQSYPVLKRTKTGNPSIDKDTLIALKEKYPEEDIFDLIFRWRTYANGRTVVRNYIELTDDNDIIRTKINTNRAKTGRQSSEGPNLNNVAVESVKKNLYTIPSRKCFGARDNHILYLVDYSGIEMRLIISESGEPVMIDLLRKGLDPHAYASELFFGRMWTDRDYCIRNYLPENKNMLEAFKEELRNRPHEREKVKDEYFVLCKGILRGAAKNGQFALAYGASLKRIASTLSLDIDFLRPGYETYCKACPKIANFTSDTAHKAKEKGYIITKFGRKLYFTKDMLWSAGNFLIQGTAAGILKRAEVKIAHYFKTTFYLKDLLHLILPIHDELIMENSLECDYSYRNKIMHECSLRMVDMPQIPIPLDVEWKISTSTWNKAKKYDYKKSNDLLYKYKLAA